MVAALIRKQIAENAAREQSQTAYVEQYHSLAERCEALQAQYDTLQQQKRAPADPVRCHKRLVFRFQNGSEAGLEI